MLGLIGAGVAGVIADRVATRFVYANRINQVSRGIDASVKNMIDIDLKKGDELPDLKQMIQTRRDILNTAGQNIYDNFSKVKMFAGFVTAAGVLINNGLDLSVLNDAVNIATNHSLNEVLALIAGVNAIGGGLDLMITRRFGDEIDQLI